MEIGVINTPNTFSGLDMELSFSHTPEFNREAHRRDLPPEILFQIFSLLSGTQNQSTLHSCTLVSRLWYSAAVQALYIGPSIGSKNLSLFVSTICPSINSHVKKNGLADMVKSLDMGMVEQIGSKSLTARILRRCKDNLEEFVAPQANFAYVYMSKPQVYQSLTTLQHRFLRRLVKMYQSSSARSLVHTLHS